MQAQPVMADHRQFLRVYLDLLDDEHGVGGRSFAIFRLRIHDLCDWLRMGNGLIEFKRRLSIKQGELMGCFLLHASIVHVIL